MSTKQENITNPQSCWNKAANDEPVFVLRANDFRAPGLVIMWANQYALNKGGFARMNERERAKFAEALEVAQDMSEWRMRTIEDDIPF